MEMVGWGFRPTDEELVDFYLKHKLRDDDPGVHVLTDIDLSHVEPWEISEMLEKSVIPFKDSKWFFFSPVNLKYSNSKRFKRTTKSGFWKPTGKTRDVRTEDTNTVIGSKKTLVFHSGHASKGVNSSWVIHEYHALNSLQSQNAFVLCCLRKKHWKTTEGGTDEEESSSSVVLDYENQAIAEGFRSRGTFTGMETICQATHQAEKCISPIEQSLIEFEQDDDAYFRNENNIMEIPRETMQTVCEITEISFESLQIPCETMQTPCETMQIVCETMQTPCETIPIFCEIMQIPCKTMQTACETTQISFKSLHIPHESMQIPCETMHTPYETMHTPCETMQILSKSMQTPCETMQEPCETMQISCETMYIPCESIEAPFEIMQVPCETIDTPFGSMETPSDTKQIPSETTRMLLEPENYLLADERVVPQSKSLKRAYCESSYIDAEIVPKQLGGTVSGAEPIFQANSHSETYVSQIPRSSTEEASSFPNYPLNNAYFRNENCFIQFSSKITKKDEFLNRIIADENLDIDEDNIYTFVNNSISKDTNIVDSSSIYNGYSNDEEYHSSKRIKLSEDVIDDASSNQETKKSMILDNFYGIESSSYDSSSNDALEINYAETSSSRSIS